MTLIPARPERTYALVVGIEQYRAGRAWELDGPARDARRFVDWLSRRGVPAGNIALFLSPLEANQALLQGPGPAAQPAVEHLVSGAIHDVLRPQPGEVLFLFWSGHGILTPEGSRRLFYADATQTNKRNLDLNSLLATLRSDYFAGFPQQICIVNACANYVEDRMTVSLPGETFPRGLPETGRAQFVFLAAKAGERAKNVTARQAGLFSDAVLEELEQAGEEHWPPDMARVAQALERRFATWRQEGLARQTPTYFWYRDWDDRESELGSAAMEEEVREVFVSYASEDSTTAEAVCATLEDAGLRCWIAPRDILPGADYGEAIVEAISESRVLVLVFSAAANRSPHVRREVERAASRDVPVLTFRIEDVPPSRSLEYFVSSLHWLDAWSGSPDRHLPYLAATIKRLVAGDESPPAPAASRPARDAAAAAPAVEARPAPPNNLPHQLTSLVGREQELEEMKRLLSATRLLTLSGPGGCGKTRLALQVASELAGQFAEGVFFVALAEINDPALVPSIVAQTIGIREEPTRPVRESLKEYLQERQVLLLLDNFEQVLPAAPQVSELLAYCSRLTVLATSRAALHVRGEKEFPVPPLALPDLKRRPSPETVSRSPAVQLFVQRAAAVQPGFSVTEENAREIAEVCVRLDGLPLAIELAAARVRLLSPHAILAQLARRGLRLLTGGQQDLPDRHKTLQAAIAWSYDLLGEEEQTLFERLAVFAGGWTLEAAEAVVSGQWSVVSSQRMGESPPTPPFSHSPIPSLDVLEGLETLVENSLVQREESEDGEPRFAMLRTVHDFALERLEQAGEAESMRRRHAEYFRTVAEEAEPKLTGPDQEEWLDALDREHNNLRAALNWAAAGDPETGLRLVGALWRFWMVRGHISEGRASVEGTLAQVSAADPELGRSALRARALDSAGALAHEQCDLKAATAYLEESLALWRETGDRPGLARCFNLLANVAFDEGDTDRARSLYEEALALYREIRDTRGTAMVLNNLGTLAHNHGENDQAAELLEESLRLKRILGNKYGLAISLDMLGNVEKSRGDYSRAASFYEEALALRRELGHKQGVVMSLNNLGSVLLAQDRPVEARVSFHEGLALSCELPDIRGTADSLAGLAGVAAAEGRHESSARLYGAAAALRQTHDLQLMAADQAVEERFASEARAALGEEAFNAALAEGHALPPEEAIAGAMANTEP
jgi:predicted ATPase/Tfp pilus assembly protein PilF